MKPVFTLILLLAVCLSGCNLPARTTATPTPTATLTPTASPAPTDTAPPPPPTAAPAVEPSPTAILVTQPPTATQPPPTATQPPASPTQSYPTPIARALFTGTFAGGTLKFRTGDPPNRVIPKSVILKGADCKEGGVITTSIAFEPPPSFEIANARFTMSESNVTISGQFLSESRAGGTITLRLRTKGQTCTIGPLPWIATASGG